MTALRWLVSSGGCDQARFRRSRAAASPQFGSEPLLPNAALGTYGNFPKTVSIVRRQYA